MSQMGTELRLPEGFDASTLHPPVLGSIEIAAPRATVWAVIAEPGNLPTYHPHVESNEASSWDASLARDRLRYFSGLTLHRDVHAWLEGEGYDLSIGESFERPVGIVSWRIAARAEEASHFSIALHLLRRPDGRPQSERARDRFSRYLDSIVRGLEQVATTGQAVTEDQFGKVEGYSR